MIQVDYAFLKIGESDPTITVLTAFDVDRGIGGATTVIQKGLADGFPEKWLEEFLHGTGYDKITVQVDPESSVEAVAKKATGKMPDTIVCWTKRDDYQNEGVELWHRTLEGQIRAVSLELDTHMEERVLSEDSGLIAWIVLHSVWTLYCYHPIRRGKTRFELMEGHKYEGNSQLRRKSACTSSFRDSFWRTSA